MTYAIEFAMVVSPPREHISPPTTNLEILSLQLGEELSVTLELIASDSLQLVVIIAACLDTKINVSWIRLDGSTSTNVSARCAFFCPSWSSRCHGGNRDTLRLCRLW